MSTMGFVGMFFYSSFQGFVANTESSGHIARGCMVSAAMMVSVLLTARNAGRVVL